MFVEVKPHSEAMAGYGVKEKGNNSHFPTTAIHGL